MRLDEKVEQAKVLLKSGDVLEARRILRSLITEYPDNESLLLWYAHSLDDDNQRIILLERYINQNPEAKKIPEYLNIYRTRSEKNSPDKPKTISEKIKQARSALLDLGMRNSLINYRLLRARGLEIIEADPQNVYEQLVTNGKKLGFLPLSEEVIDKDKQVSKDISLSINHLKDDVNTKTRERGKNNKLQTSHLTSDLDKRLLNSYRIARSHMEEQGVNILFIALGMLHWYESQDSTVLRKAPLILIPVNIHRTDIQSPFQIIYTGDDIGDNLSLSTKLEQDFGLNFPSLDETDELDLYFYFQQVALSVQRMTRWSVDETAIHLGFFSFSTLLMFNDLLEETWQEIMDITNQEILRSILQDGFKESIPELNSELLIDDIVDPQIARHVVDADSSQITALLAVRNGNNLVIQGPPGTGKSQTITNIIAEALGQDKRILFVAEKMAALEVVKRRLDNINLGDACLELHSNKTSKSTVLDELQRTYNLGQPKIKDYEIDIELLKDYRDRLNAYSRAANTAIANSLTTPFQCYGRLLELRQKLKDKKLPQLDFAPMHAWSEGDFRKQQETVNELQTLLTRTGIPKKHPFWTTTHTIYSPSIARSVNEECEQLDDTIRQIMKTSDELSSHLGISTAEDRTTLVNYLEIIHLLTEAPDLSEINVKSHDWLTKVDTILALLKCAQSLIKIHEEYNTTIKQDTWTADLSTVKEIYDSYKGDWWRFIVKKFREAKLELANHCVEKLPKGLTSQLALIDAILESQRITDLLAKEEAFLTGLFGDSWQRLHSNWSYLEEVITWLNKIHKVVDTKQIPVEIFDYLQIPINKEYLEAASTSIIALLDNHKDQANALLQAMALTEEKRFGEKGAFTLMEFIQQMDYIDIWKSNLDRMQDMISYNSVAKRLDQVNLKSVTDVASDWEEANQLLVYLFQRTWYEGLLDIAFSEHRALATFDGITHSQCIERFRKLDQLQFQYNQARLANQHWKNIPKNSTNGQIGVLLKEFAKKRRHKPIRKLMIEAGNAIQAIKPVFMMSPLSIAAYLPPGSVQFDLVVFDEASQVKPAHAYGAILRGKQIVVTGDDKQLPPTTFFEQILKGDDDEEEENLTADMESILGLFCGQGAPQKMLNWHYRSRHESLIAVSNYEFYNNQLTIFPSPDDSREYFGLVFKHLPEAWYDRGKSHTNPREAKTVAQAVMHHAKLFPNKTLGVAAFSTAQAHAIENHLEALRRVDSTHESFFSNHTAEPFFIKNLENVQGDERDVIFISVGYGRSKDGHLTMNFGPLNREGGERRLNVLITRARDRCVVFSNLTSQDIDTSRTQATGVVALKRYLKYAETGNLDIPVSTGKDADSPFEEDVAFALRNMGYQIEHQVGSAGFYIDLAVKDDQHPGQYLLGIECDGATYHSARSARDRDRIRQDILESLGWDIHRIWSTDWFKHRQQEIERLRNHIEKTKSEPISTFKGYDTIAQSTPEKKTHIAREARNNKVTSPEIITYKVAKLNRIKRPLDTIYQQTYATWVVKVVTVESPVHVDVVVQRIREAANGARIGPNIRKEIDRGISYAYLTKGIIKRGDFLWHPQMKKPLVRDRSKLSSSSRKIEIIPPEEIAEAILSVVTESMGMIREDIPKAVCRKLGIARKTVAIQEHIDALVNGLLGSADLVTQGDYLQIKSD